MRRASRRGRIRWLLIVSRYTLRYRGRYGARSESDSVPISRNEPATSSYDGLGDERLEPLRRPLLLEAEAPAVGDLLGVEPLAHRVGDQHLVRARGGRDPGGDVDVDAEVVAPELARSQIG